MIHLKYFKVKLNGNLTIFHWARITRVDLVTQPLLAAKRWPNKYTHSTNYTWLSFSPISKPLPATPERRKGAKPHHNHSQVNRLHTYSLHHIDPLIIVKRIPVQRMHRASKKTAVRNNLATIDNVTHNLISAPNMRALFCKTNFAVGSNTWRSIYGNCDRSATFIPATMPSRKLNNHNPPGATREEFCPHYPPLHLMWRAGKWVLEYATLVKLYKLVSQTAREIAWCCY